MTDATITPDQAVSDAPQTQPPVDSLGVPVTPPREHQPTQHYQASWGRKGALSFVLLLVLPFLISMPIMVVMRATRGFWFDAITLAIAGGVFLFACIFILFHAHAAWRTRFAVTDKALFMTVPKWRGPTPGFRHIDYKVPYENIARVECRNELFEEIGVPVMMKAVSIVSNDNQRFVLGYQVDEEADPAVPIMKIADEVAKRAGLETRDCGCHRLGSQYKTLISRKQQDWDREPDVTEDSYRRLKARNRAVMTVLATALIAMAAYGFITELYSGGYLWKLDWFSG